MCGVDRVHVLVPLAVLQFLPSTQCRIVDSAEGRYAVLHLVVKLTGESVTFTGSVSQMNPTAEEVLTAERG